MVSYSTKWKCCLGCMKLHEASCRFVARLEAFLVFAIGMCSHIALAVHSIIKQIRVRIR
jgi:hypothetical protein